CPFFLLHVPLLSAPLLFFLLPPTPQFYSLSLPYALPISRRCRRSTARCCDRWEASSSVSVWRSATLTSSAPESSSRMRMRQGWARPLKRFALTSYRGRRE